jgi:hypothetical protein
MTAVAEDTDLITIEHLDHTPMCELNEPGRSCGGANPAGYYDHQTWCHPMSVFICQSCVDRRVQRGVAGWQCSTCQRPRVCRWTDFIILTPIRS